MKRLINEFNKIDKSILKVMKSGLHFSFVFCIIATFFLALYIGVHIPKLFYIGISLFQSSLFFFVAFIAYGFVFNRVKQITHS